MTSTLPGYRNLLEQGELERRVKAAQSHLAACDVCPWACGVNRLAGELGICQTGALARVSSYGPHPGEERPLSGQRGSGTIFFARCNLRCIFCQNADISQLLSGRESAPDELAEIMLSLQDRGCHNINLVSPSHVIPQVLDAVNRAAMMGLKLPLVYNSGGYDSLEMLTLLYGVVDIYMPDMKYGDATTAEKYSLIKHYPQVNQAAVLEMQRQVGDLTVDSAGIAVKGLLVRHLVLPNELADSEKIFEFLASHISKNVYLNVMAQYRPSFKAWDYPELSRRIQPEEYQRALKLAQKHGLSRLDR